MEDRSGEVPVRLTRESTTPKKDDSSEKPPLRIGRRGFLIYLGGALTTLGLTTWGASVIKRGINTDPNTTLQPQNDLPISQTEQKFHQRLHRNFVILSTRTVLYNYRHIWYNLIK